MNRRLRSLILTIQSAFGGYPPQTTGQALDFPDPQLYPIFIVGAPRTGSTLLYQLMIRHFRVAYISNGMALFPAAMLFIAKCAKPWMLAYQAIRESKTGYVPGLLAPSEAGAIMRQWFELSPADERVRVRNTVIKLSLIMGAPLLIKNLPNSLRLERILLVLPEARFLHITRDPLFTAQSIVLSGLIGSASVWADLARPVIEQSGDPLCQALLVRKIVEETVTRFFDQRSVAHITVAYEKICRNPVDELSSIGDSFDLQMNENLTSNSLKSRQEIRLSDDEWNRLAAYHSALHNQEIGPR